VEPTSSTCRACASNPKYTHTEREHELADQWIPFLYAHIKQDVFTDRDRPISYKDAVGKYGLDVHVRRVGRVLDAVEMILSERGWPSEPRGGVAAYVVNASTGEPGDGWSDIWKVSPRDARSSARAYVRELTLAD
jgi:hypothetical protein